jgi:hypothetical protein
VVFLLKHTGVQILFPLAFLLSCFSLFAREVEIVVEDIELNLPLEGAVIRSWDGAEYVCDTEGKALVSVPDDRQVVIQAAYPGYGGGRLAVRPGETKYTLGLRLTGVLESRELVIEASRPGSGDTRTGRSVAVTEREIAQTGEIGLIEDVMNTIKLLPGVGYTGLFNAQPSIRGGEPGDMSASLDGYYIDNPYHWGGGFSIFDPRMVQSAQLSHGVFSTRYGHTISGLLEVSAKKPPATETEFELGLTTSSANFNLSLPLFGKGGILFMGRVTYYDPVIWAAKQMAQAIPELAVINYVRVAPYIRSGAITADYRFYDNLELQATAFWGMDGVGVTYENSYGGKGGLVGYSDMTFDYANYQGFITSGLSWNPRRDMLLKTTLGTGYRRSDIDGDIINKIGKFFTADFKAANPLLFLPPPNGLGLGDFYQFSNTATISERDNQFNVQTRLDYDWELGNGMFLAAGAQEMFSRFSTDASQRALGETWFENMSADDQARITGQLGVIPDSLRVIYPISYTPSTDNKLFTTSAYTLTEYHDPDNRFGAELGARLDHFYLIGDGFSLPSAPVLNPRFNFDLNLFKSGGHLRSLDLSAGTGLFSSMNGMVAVTEARYKITEVRPNRSWTSVLGTKLNFAGGLSLNLEGYYKYIYDRAYVHIPAGAGVLEPKVNFDGEGRVWGIDLMLQKAQSRYWDGWLSYSFNWARYRDPHGGTGGVGFSGGNRGKDWYFPSYHRFHNLNLVLNIKPVPRINIYTRLGLASGAQIAKRTGSGPVSYPVYVYDPDNPEKNQFIEKFYWLSKYDENNRTTPSIPLDIKFSILGNNHYGKTRYEIYVAVENALALLYTSQGNTSFNQYTGEEDTGSQSASYEIPIPIPSFGFKLSY